jgi:hypothetical protein
MGAATRVAGRDTWRMEQFSQAYVQAVASAVGCIVTRPPFDLDSTDLTLSRKRQTRTGRTGKLDVQLKSTAADCIRGTDVHFPLKQKNYDELRDDNISVPRILIVVAMNADVTSWMTHTEANMALFKCGYWLSLRGFGPSTSTHSTTVHLPRLQVFDPTGLQGIFARIEGGGLP